MDKSVFFIFIEHDINILRIRRKTVIISVEYSEFSMMYIYQNPDWHKFTWNGEKIQKLLFDIKKAQGYLLGKMDTLGFEVKNNAYMQVLTENIIKSR